MVTSVLAGSIFWQQYESYKSIQCMKNFHFTKLYRTLQFRVTGVSTQKIRLQPACQATGARDPGSGLSFVSTQGDTPEPVRAPALLRVDVIGFSFSESSP